MGAHCIYMYIHVQVHVLIYHSEGFLSLLVERTKATKKKAILEIHCQGAITEEHCNI